MANEIQHTHGATGSTLYFVISDDTGDVWDTTGTPAFETRTVAKWANGDYKIAMTETPASSYFYLGTLPAAAAETITVTVYNQAGGSPAVSDSIVGTFDAREWNGTNYTPPVVDLTHINGDAASLVTAIDSNLTEILDTALTETSAGYLAAALTKFLDVAVPALVASDVMRGTDNAATVGAAMTLANGSIKAVTYDGSTAYPVDDSLRDTLFAGDTVYVDTVDGTASTAWPYGTPTYPTSTMANGLTIADANTLQQINVRGAVTLGAALEGYSLRGYGQYDIAQVFNVSDESIERSTFASMLISGATGSAALVTDQTRYQDCYLLTHSEINGAMLECAIDGATSVITAGHAWFRNCHFGLKTACVLTVNNPSTCEIENPTGDVTLATMAGGTVNVYCSKSFGVTINGTCTAGTINLYGPVTVTDNSGAGCTVNLYPDASNVTQVDGTGVEASGGNLKVVAEDGLNLMRRKDGIR